MINEVLFATLHEACENLRMGPQYSLNIKKCHKRSNHDHERSYGPEQEKKI